MRSSSSATSLALLVLATSAAFGLPSPDSRPNGQVMRLNRRVVQRTPEQWAVWLKSHRENLHRKYNPRASSSKHKRGSGTNYIVDQNADSSYFGSLAIGTPGTAFDVILDTGSADLWVAGSACTTGCEDITTFDTSDSSTFSNLSTTFSITYGSGEASGDLAEDTVQMAGFSVSNQTFAICDEVSDGLLTAPVSGLLGLAWQSIAASGATPFWQNLVENNAWDDPVMSFYLTRYGNESSAQTQEFGGAFTMGFTNSTYYTGDIEYKTLATSTGSYWLLEISEITSQGSSISLTSGSSSYAAIDTGTTGVGGPSDAIADIYAQITDSEAGTGSYDGYYLYPCDTDVSVTISYGGSTWTIASADFELAQVSKDQCVGSFFVLDSTSGSSTPAWIVGDTFLKNVYSVFRYSPAAVGFANLSSYVLETDGDLDADVPTPTLGSVAAAITATSNSSTRSSASLPMKSPPLFIALGTLALTFAFGILGLL